MKLIDADILVEKCVEKGLYGDELKGIVDELEAVETDIVVDGEWKYYVNDEGRARWKCSRCGKICRHDPVEKVRCSKCGARMKKEA